MDYIKKIETQEKKDRFIAVKCLTKLLSGGTDLQITQTEITDYVDLNCSIVNKKGKTIPFNVEIKERYKDDKQLAKYPNAELKDNKLKRMKSVTPKGTKLLYMVLLNNKECLLFDLDKINWDKVDTHYWHIKKTQMNPNSGYEDVLTHFIPYEMALSRIDITEYVN